MFVCDVEIMQWIIRIIRQRRSINLKQSLHKTKKVKVKNAPEMLAI